MEFPETHRARPPRVPSSRRPGEADMIDRRVFIGLMSAAAAAPAAFSQASGAPMVKRARTSVLEIAYEESGPDTGFPVVLMHGFPYDPRAFDEVVPPLTAAGLRVIVPY